MKLQKHSDQAYALAGAYRDDLAYVSERACSFKGYTRLPDPEMVTEWDGKSTVLCPTFVNGGENIVTVHRNEVQIRSIKQGILEYEREQPTFSLFASSKPCCYSYNDKVTIRTMYPNGVLIHSRKNKRLIRKFNSGSKVSALGYCSDKKLLATGHKNGKVRIWNLLPILKAYALQKKEKQKSPR